MALHLFARDIFDCIVQRMEQKDGEQATKYDMRKRIERKCLEGKRVWYPISWIARGRRCIILLV